MLSFEPINSENIMDTAEYFKHKISRTSDYTLGAMYMWRDFYNTTYTIYDNMLLFKVKFLDRTSFTVPTGAGSVDKAIKAIKEYCDVNQLPMWFCTVPEEYVTILKDQYNGNVHEPNRDWADYLYDAEDLSTLAGRHYSGQRNHINKFKKLYPNYQYCTIQKDNLSKVIKFLEDYRENFSKDSKLAREEINRSLELLPLMEKFHLPGGFIEVEDTIVSMAVGELINDTLYVHIEKANREYPGSYQMIVKEFAMHTVTEDIKYINREEDVGDEGLRISKLSYHPVKLLDKYCIQFH